MSDVKFNLACTEELMKEIENICFTDRQNEVGGFLLGHIEPGKTTVTHVIAAKHTQATSTQLTFTPETWNDLYAKQSAIQPKVTLIGWFHSHPNHGVFLSEHDQFIQQNFFKNDGQITIVVDPIRGQRGWFFSSQGNIMKYGRDRDTIRPRLGQSATDGDANVGTVMGIKEKKKGGSGRSVLWAAIFSLLSFGAGAGYTTLTHHNDAVLVQQLCKTVQNLQTQLATLSPLGEGNSKVLCDTSVKATKKTASKKATTSKVSKAPTTAAVTPAPKESPTKIVKVPVVEPSATSSKTKKPTGVKKSTKPQSSVSPTATTTGNSLASNDLCTATEKNHTRPAVNPIQKCNGTNWVPYRAPKATPSSSVSTPPATTSTTPPVATPTPTTTPTPAKP
jgi:hypothetical protein